jgi:hypothetical protein
MEYRARVEDVPLPGDGPDCTCRHDRFSHQTAAGADGPCVTNCGCAQYDPPKAADTSSPAPHSCRNCEDIDPESCLFNRPCKHPNAEYLGSISGAGQPTTKRFHCPECNERYQVQEEPESECPAACREGHTYSGSCMLRADGPCSCQVRNGFAVLHARDCNTLRLNTEGPEPPEGPEYTPCVCGHIEPAHYPDHGSCRESDCECLAYRTKPDFELPPQPERRPPYAVAYSAGGHAYEVLLPGDARAEAVDGRLVIEHPGLQVLGITRVQPVRTEGA